jgi:hypothetical protein
MIKEFKSSYIEPKDRKKLYKFYLESEDKKITLSPTRQKLLPFAKEIIASMDKNQVASHVGAAAEKILRKHYNWKKNGDIGNESGYDAIDHNGLKYEIKGMQYETKTNYVAYKHSVKANKYDILSILHFNEGRVSHIPREEVNKFIEKNKLPGRETKSLRLCFSDPIYTKLGKPRKKSLFLSLFLKYEDKEFKISLDER